MTNVVQLQQVRKQELDYLCSKCGAERGCDCNAPATRKAAVALAANPQKSDRAIAAEIGVSHPTVAKARRRAAASTGKQPFQLEKRVGADGKPRKLPARKARRKAAQAKAEQEAERQAAIDAMGESAAKFPIKDVDALADRLIGADAELARELYRILRADPHNRVGLVNRLRRVLRERLGLPAEAAE
jgi:transposase-like protein